MRYLYPRSVHNFKYNFYLRNKNILPFTIFSFLANSKRVNVFYRLTAFIILKNLNFFNPSVFNPKSVCWSYSRARWVFKDFHLSRGALKPILIDAKFPGFKPYSW